MNCREHWPKAEFLSIPLSSDFEYRLEGPIRLLFFSLPKENPRAFVERLENDGSRRTLFRDWTAQYWSGGPTWLAYDPRAAIVFPDGTAFVVRNAGGAGVLEIGFDRTVDGGAD